MLVDNAKTNNRKLCPCGEIGSHQKLKISWRQLRAGSNPALDTIIIDETKK